MKTILFVLLLLTVSAQAQHKLIDSLQVELQNARTDSARVMLNCELSSTYNPANPKMGREYALAAEKLAESINFDKGRSTAKTLLAYGHVVMGEYDKAMNCYYDALAIGETTADTATMIASYNGLGIVYNRTDNYGKAISYYQTAAGLACKINDRLSIGKVYNNIGNILEEQKEYNKALAHFRKAAAIFTEVGNKPSLAISLHNMGNVHLYLPKPGQGLTYLTQALQLQDQMGNKLAKTSSLLSISRIYEAIGEHGKALKYAHASYELSLESESSKKIAAAAELLQTLYADENNYEQAYTYLAIYTEHKAKLNQENQNGIAAEITVEYQTEKRKLESQMLQAEKEKLASEHRHEQFKTYLGIAIIALLVVLLVVMYISRSRLKKTYKALQQANSCMLEQHTKIILHKAEIAGQAQELQQQNEQLEQHHSFKNKLFSVISHDLRAPLNSIKGILNLVQTRPMSDVEVKHIFGLLGKDMDLVINMLNNVLVWAKAQLEGDNVVLQDVSIQQLVEENIRLAGLYAENKNIVLQSEVYSDVKALADKERLNFVLRNLLMNAIKFTYAGGEVKVTVQEREDTLVVAVTDNGKGISAANLDNLFTQNKFTTLGTAKEKGSGLGLLLTREFVKSMKGAIDVVSEEGKGTTFLVTLPKVTTVVQAEDAAAVLF